MTAKIIALANQKGGVGKTTSTVNLAAALAAAKNAVLLIDLDPQGNATVGCGIAKKTLTYSMNQVLLGEHPIADTIVSTDSHVDVLPANGDLTVAEVRLLKMEEKERCLLHAIEPIREKYHFILIDCPPSLSMLTVNALVCADSVIIPIQCEYYALEGLTGLLSSIERIRQTVNPDLQIEGLLRTMYDGRNRLSAEVSEQLFAHFGDKVYQTAIPRNVRLAEAPSHGLPIMYYDKNSQGAEAYLAWAGEIMKRYGYHKKKNDKAKKAKSTADAG